MKIYSNNWTREIFIVNKIYNNNNSITCKVEHLKGEEMIGSFYEYELLKSSL